MPNPLTADEDFFLPVRKPAQARPMTDEEAAEYEKDVEYVRTSLFAALGLPPPKS